MKAKIHPEYQDVTIQCACGSVVETKSTLKGRVQVEVCSSCHPFFTGKQKLMDTTGRIDRFKKKFGEKVVGTQKPTRVAAPAPAPKAPKKDVKEQLKEKQQKNAAATAEKKQ